MSENVAQKLNKVIKIDEEKIHQHLGELVRGTVEETLNKLLDAEADQLCNAARYERTEARKNTRAGHYQRNLQTKAGEVNLKVPKLREHKFETAIIERYQRRESSVEEALIEMYLAGVSVRRVEDITQALWGTRVSPGTVSNLNQKIYKRILERLKCDYHILYFSNSCIFRSIANRIPFDREQRSDSSRTAFRLIANTIPEHPEQEKPTY